MKALPLSLLLLSGVALADDDAIRKCRALTDTGARLACYDGIQLNAARAAPAAAAAVAAAPARNREADFGMEAVRQREAEPASVTSTVVGDFEGWGPNSQIRLANGQVWRITDGSEATLPRTRNAKVTVERNMFGTLFLKVDGSNSSAKVRRVQ
ncbi:hypothetical protein [Telluria aromaticivorans]|uniref:Uncharacterized protein n=1 Tax=Telluria aromaticivorans TaxID=2725995 RepID=A0A7Y2NZC5_9BURK|nr:hypothetical protein [Telluria aromaticivorans]NNG21674.1 hypothetical protein [Telluria aromaticivorans]